MLFWSTRYGFPWAYNNNQKSSPTKAKRRQIFRNSIIPRSKKSLQCYIGFLNYYWNYVPRLVERLTPFFQLLKATDAKAKNAINRDKMKEFKGLNEPLSRCCQQALRKL